MYISINMPLGNGLIKRRNVCICLSPRKKISMLEQHQALKPIKITAVSMQFLYLPAATVLKRWSGETASNVYIHVDESLHGMEVRLVMACMYVSVPWFECVYLCVCMCASLVSVHFWGMRVHVFV